MTEAMVEQIRRRLQQALTPQELDVIDEGYKHAGHEGEGKGHFHVRIVSAAFAGKSSIVRHRMIYSALEGLMNHGIHALSIDANAV
jgi:BolA protein